MRVADTTSVASRIELAFQSASTSTGTSFDYLVKTAARESSFNPTAKAKTSSATGLFQFIESTWLETMKQAGPEHGLQKYSDQIHRTKSGKYYVKDAEMRKEILDLRKDVEISSKMAGAYTQKNAQYLERKIGREPTDGELYMAHFLGAGGASRLIDATRANPDMRADKIFAAQARANKPIFYHRNGKARSMEEVYQVIVSKHDAVTMIAEVSGKKNLRTSGELRSVATLPNAKPMQHVPTVDPNTFDHLAGDKAAAFAMRSKPTGSTPAQPTIAQNSFDPLAGDPATAFVTRAKPMGPVQLAALEQGPPPLPTDDPVELARTTVPVPEVRAERPVSNPVELAKASVPIPDSRPQKPVDAAPSPVFPDDLTVVASATQPEPQVPQNPQAASLNAVDNNDATTRVLSAFQAAETVNPFEALFRNDQESSQAGLNPRFASAFQAVEEAALFSALSGSSNQVAAQELALANQGGPLDLTRFLRLKAEEEQKDLLPPA
ncbi:MAG: transglycosylase SLT domain-containing protein [Roseibium sp.]|nr:transglycosylase SLT domain-containing protein [Roseibium sp.]